MPHTSSPHSPLDGAHLAADPASGVALLDRLEGLVAERQGDDRVTPPRGPRTDEPSQSQLFLPSVIVVVDDALVDRARLTALAERGPDVGRSRAVGGGAAP